MTIRAFVAAAVLFGLGAAGPVKAIPISDTIDPSPDILISFTAAPTPCPSGFTCSVANLSWVHDITDNGFALGDTIDSATLVVHLTDTGGSETYSYTIGIGQTETHLNVGASQFDTHVLSVSSLADLQLDGTISITITHTGAPGSSPRTPFSFADATLTAEVTEFAVVNPNRELPVPGTLFLFGIGLAIFAGRSRRRI